MPAWTAPRGPRGWRPGEGEEGCACMPNPTPRLARQEPKEAAGHKSLVKAYKLIVPINIVVHGTRPRYMSGEQFGDSRGGCDCPRRCLCIFITLTPHKRLDRTKKSENRTLYTHVHGRIHVNQSLSHTLRTARTLQGAPEGRHPLRPLHKSSPPPSLPQDPPLVPGGVLVGLPLSPAFRRIINVGNTNVRYTNPGITIKMNKPLHVEE